MIYNSSITGIERPDGLTFLPVRKLYSCCRDGLTELPLFVTPIIDFLVRQSDVPAITSSMPANRSPRRQFT